MSNSKTRKTDRVLSIVLAIMMLVSVMPTTVFASTVNNPNEFTLTVKDSGDALVDDADVSYEIFVDSESKNAGTVKTANGEAVIPNVSDYETDITDGKTVEINYTVEKDGYVSVSKSEAITDVKGNIDVVLTEIPPEEVVVSVTKTGDGTIELNGTEQLTATVVKGSKVELKVVPAAGSYIKMVTINGIKQKITDKNLLERTIDATDNVEITVEFVKTYTVSVTSNEGGTVKVNDENVISKEYDENSSIELTAVAKDGYQIANVAINGVEQVVTDVNSFSKELTVTSDVNISVYFVKVYTVTVTYNGENGTVDTDPACVAGSVTVKTGEKVGVTATAKENYRVSKVVITGRQDEIFEDNTYVKSNPYKTTLDADKDYSVEITFAPILLDITLNTPENGKVSIDNAKVDFGNEANITIIPFNGYKIATVTVNDVDFLAQVTSDAENTYNLKLENIQEDKNVNVSFVKTEVVSLKEITWNDEDALRVIEDSRTYIFKAGTEVVFKTDESGIKINGKSTGYVARYTPEYIVEEDITVFKIEEYIFFGGWGDPIEGVSESNPLNIVFDGKAPETTLTFDSKHSGSFYNADFSVDIAAEDKDYYSGIEKVEYFVTDTDIPSETKYDDVEDSAKTQAGVLYTHDGIINSKYNGNVTINVTDDKNNSDYVAVWVKVTDRAGNVSYTRSENNLVNCTAPVLKSVSVDGVEHSEAETGYFNTQRKATIVIIDRASSFDETAANNGFVITAKNGLGEAISISKPSMISWNHNGDTHTATIKFNIDATYEWSFDYTNEAGLTMDKNNVVESGSNIYNFTIDKHAPNAEIFIDAENKWSELVSALTFHIWKKYDVTVNTSCSDVTSPIKEVVYYKSNTDESLGVTELDALYANGDFVSDAYTISADEKFTVYARVTDYAGNTLYLSTDGLIVDTSVSRITLTPELANSNGFYNNDVDVNISVSEIVEGKDSYSGIKTIDYRILRDNMETESGNLYTFNVKKPIFSQLINQKEFNITVKAQDNNSDNVKVIVTAVDNAGNVSSEEISLAINVDEVKASITLDGNPNKIVGERGYYDMEARTATIIITDRASAFDEIKASEGIVINAVDAKGNAVEDAYEIIGWNNDGDKHTAKVIFSENANYVWSYNYTNLAGNSLDVKNKLNTGDSETPFEFTVDDKDPEGNVTVNENTWYKLLDTLTFGIFNRVRADVRATYSDETSPVKVEYYKVENDKAPIILDKEKLNALYEDGKFVLYDKEFSVESDEQFVVYLRITDYAGRYKYVSSDGAIVDTKASTITMKPSLANGFYGAEENNAGEYGIYNKESNVIVDIKVEDAEPYSGIKTVEYWVENNGVKTQGDLLFEFKNAAPKQEDLVSSWEGQIVVDKDTNNSCNTFVYVKTVDNAVNDTTESVKLDIDITAPTIDVTFDNNKDNNGNGYFKDNNDITDDAVRTATVVITERKHHFSAEKATEGIVITAVDAEGKTVEDAYTISSWKEKIGNTPDETTYTATIAFNKDANYSWSIAYTDEAGNKNTAVDTHNSVAPFEFTIDTVVPEGTVTAQSKEGREATWNDTVEDLRFGFWSKEMISISETHTDVTSKDVTVEYYLHVAENPDDKTVELSDEELDKVTDWKSFEAFDITENNRFVVYIKITDAAGNYNYISTNGLIVDDKHPDIESVAPEITVTPEKPINGIYKDDVKVAIKVVDPTEGGTYSGLNTITYKVFDRASATPDVPTQEGELFLFDNDNPKHNELVNVWEDEIIVESAKNNSNDIQVVIYAEDNAGNATDNAQEGSQSYTVIKIDTTAPIIDISYDNNDVENKKFFKKDRVATIKITERNFNAGDVKITITNEHDYIPSVIGWKDIEGTYNLDDSTHTATIKYDKNGDYTFKIEYTDLAGNVCSEINYAEGTKAAEVFTVDKTIPTVKVTYDNNDALNGNYYKAVRTATVTIKEHNFNPKDVKAIIDATDDGKPTTEPKLKGWKNDGDTHTATIYYPGDAKYTFDITFKDKAGNSIKDFKEQIFFVDKTAPTLEITGVANNSANKGDVVPVVTYSDTNYDTNNVNITLSGANRGSGLQLVGSYADIHNGRTFTFKNFAEEKSVDDIYTLRATLTDKAGNSTEKYISFSVNRFGSTYSMDEATEKLIGKYVQEPQDVVVTETNANELDNIKVTLFKNDKIIALKEGKDYTISVTGGNGRWYQYTYKVLKKNFADDGVYSLKFYSEDAAGGIAENTLDTKNTNVNFGIDKTAPTIVVSNLESKETYPEEIKTVNFSVEDNLQLTKVVVLLDGKEYKSWEGKDLKTIIDKGGNFEFTIDGTSTDSHDVKIIATDAADVEGVEEITDFYVTTNVWVNYYNNKPLFFGSIAGVLVVAGLIIFFVVKKKKKDEEENK